MKTNHYRKIYPFEKSIFCEKFFAIVLPNNSIKSITMPISKKVKNNRVFLGNIKNNCLKVVTYPDVDIWGTFFLNPRLFFKRLFIMMSPMCIYGNISEYKEQTVVNFIVSKMRGTEIIAKLQCIILFICDFGIIMGMVSGQTTYNFFLIPILLFLALFHISLFFMMKISKKEVDALIKFMNDLEFKKQQ